MALATKGWRMTVLAFGHGTVTGASAWACAAASRTRGARTRASERPVTSMLLLRGDAPLITTATASDTSRPSMTKSRADDPVTTTRLVVLTEHSDTPSPTTVMLPLTTAPGSATSAESSPRVTLVERKPDAT